MARIIYDEPPVFVPFALSLDQATATFNAVRDRFMTTHDRDLAQAMLIIAQAIDKKVDEIETIKTFDNKENENHETPNH